MRLPVWERGDEVTPRLPAWGCGAASSSSRAGTRHRIIFQRENEATSRLLVQERGIVLLQREVRGIANSKNSVLMQGLVYGRWSICDHPKATGTRHHGALKNFLFGMERIHPYEAEVCHKFSTLLDLEGCSRDCISEELQFSNFLWTEVKDMNSCRGKSEIMSFYGFFILMGGLILHGAKDEGSFKAHAPYLREAFDRGTKVIQHAEAKLRSVIAKGAWALA
ncbi:hypothetical protein GW17_00061460 [Ensete ventricosum]|nr:hypothetical protein GW17_00061460 [Ensete ventricosum]